MSAPQPNQTPERGATSPRAHAELRVAFITHYTELYGANLSLLNLIEGLSQYGVKAHVICPDQGDLLTALAQRGIPAAVLPFEWWVSSERSPHSAAARLLQNIRRLRPITAQMVRWDCNLVYSNSSVFAIGAWAANHLALPHVWHLREFGRRDYDLKPDFGLQLSRLGFRTADQIICVSRALQRALLGRSPLPNSHVIYNGVAPEAVFEARRKAAEALRGRKQPFTFVLVGRFRESKGQAVALRAFAKVAARHADVRLLLVGGAGQTGDQDYFEHCRALATELAVADRTDFWGYIPDPERAFLAADAALMCSRNEAMGRVSAEAMSACRPVIGFDNGGTSELVAHERTGLLYRDDPDALSICMERYVTDPELARQHGEAGWQLARQRHTIETYAAQIADVLRRVQQAHAI